MKQYQIIIKMKKKAKANKKKKEKKVEEKCIDLENISNK